MNVRGRLYRDLLEHLAPLLKGGVHRDFLLGLFSVKSNRLAVASVGKTVVHENPQPHRRYRHRHGQGNGLGRAGGIPLKLVILAAAADPGKIRRLLFGHAAVAAGRELDPHRQRKGFRRRRCGPKLDIEWRLSSLTAGNDQSG